ncbi:MAG: hypothetical protein LUD12_13275 [Lachnospiraceae bacterium]|nr:hypothetical protein [Lachnospiraceae bacterium]
MKFKEITPGMVIHCQTKEDARALLEKLEELGYKDNNTIMSPRINHSRYCRIIDDWGYQWYCEVGKDIKITEFSDLIEPEPRFKVGDRVRIKENLMKNGVYGELEMLGDMMIWKGSESNVSAVTENGKYALKSLPYYWAEEMLEPVNDLNTSNALNEKSNAQMSAVEVLEWLRHHAFDSISMKEAFDNSGGILPVFGKYTSEEILQKITAYEAAKKTPKPVEAEYGKLLYVSVKNKDTELYESYSKFEYWSNEQAESYETVKANFLSEAARETQKTVRVTDYDICRAKKSE